MKQKNLKSSKTTKNKRERSKYPNLDKSLNVKSRQNFMDSEYINGAYDENGVRVIRPLNDDEKKWLNTFMGEYYGAKFEEDSILLKNSKCTKELENKLKSLKKKLSDPFSKGGESDEEARKQLHREVSTIKDEIYYTNVKKHTYGSNNARNRDMYNYAQKTGNLKLFDPAFFENKTVGILDEIQDMHHFFEYDEELLDVVYNSEDSED